MELGSIYSQNNFISLGINKIYPFYNSFFMHLASQVVHAIRIIHYLTIRLVIMSHS